MLSLISTRLCIPHQETRGIRGQVLFRNLEEHKYTLAFIYSSVFMQKLYLLKCHDGSLLHPHLVYCCAESSPAELEHPRSAVGAMFCQRSAKDSEFTQVN